MAKRTKIANQSENGKKAPSLREIGPANREMLRPSDVKEERVFSTAMCFVGESRAKLWGMTAVERARKLFHREGIADELSLPEARSYGGLVIIVRADAVFDGALVSALIKRPNFILLSEEDDSAIVLGANVRGHDIDHIVALFDDPLKIDYSRFVVRRPEELQVSFVKNLVKRETPFAVKINDSNVRDVEWRMFMSTYKGATDLVTKHVWPVPAFHVTRFLSARGVTPNLVTSIGAVAMLVAFYLFLHGSFLPGLLFAWLMTFLDTVDGKLARTTLTSSYWGDIFDHGIDLVHPPFWYLAWVFGLPLWGINWSQQKITWVLVLIFGGYILQRIMEGIAIKWLRLVIHIWRPIDTFFRKVTARRNPNLVILTVFALASRPDLGIVAVAIWTIVCLILHGLQLVQALLHVSHTGQPLKSWMDGS